MIPPTRLILLSSLLLPVPMTPALGDITSIPITAYTGGNCYDPSITSPNISLSLDVCAVTPRMKSFTLNPIPCSTSNNVVWYTFRDAACGVIDDFTTYLSGTCVEWANNAHQDPIAAILLSCELMNEGAPAPISTTIIPIGPVAVAPTATALGAGSSSKLSSTGAAAGSGSTKGNTTDTTGSTGSSSSSSSCNGWSCL